MGCGSRRSVFASGTRLLPANPLFCPTMRKQSGAMARSKAGLLRAIRPLLGYAIVLAPLNDFVDLKQFGGRPAVVTQ